MKMMLVADDQENDNKTPLLETTEAADTELQSPKSQDSPTAIKGELKPNNPLAVSLRSKLQLLQDFSYICKDEVSLATVNDCVESAVCAANSLLKCKGGLVLQPTPPEGK